MNSIRKSWLLGVVATLTVSACNCGGVSIKSLTLSPENPSLQKGKTVQLTSTVTFGDDTTKDVTELGAWTSANESIATVSNSVGSKGLVTAKAVGTAKIKVLYQEKPETAGVEVETTITVTAAPRGTVVVVPGSTPLATTEAGGTATFTVALSSKPDANVVIGLSSSDQQEGTVSVASLTLTGDNWNAPQTVTVTGVDDQIADGAKTYKIATAPAVSTDEAYNGVDGDDLNATNADNDTAGITVTPNTGLTTSENGDTATFTVVLNSKPTGDVVIALTSSISTEGTPNPAALTFTGMSWNAPQTVTITGIDDTAADGDKMYVIATAAAVSTDTGYNGLDADDVAVTNTDNDTAGITVTAASGLQTSEAANGPTATFTIKLNTQPSANVIIGLSSSNTAEGTVAPASLTFTNTNWAAAQTVTVTGVDDSIADGNQMYNIVTAAAVSTDTKYNGLASNDVQITNIDNDSAGFTVTPLTLSVNESGTTATFTIKPNTQPTANVTVSLASSNTAEATVSPANLTFTTANWNAAQTVTVTGVDDQTQDGDQMFTITTGAAVSTDTRYNGIDAANVTGTNVDNDTAGFTVAPTSGLTTSEATGGTATFTVKLNTQPTANVLVTFFSSNIQEGTVSPSTLTFTSANWSGLQTVTITGVDDQIVDGDQGYQIVGSAAVSSDARYSGRSPGNVTVTNRDNDTPGFVLSAISGNTTEAGGSATFTMNLRTQPASQVVVSLSSSNTAEGTVFPASITFNNTNWAAAQTVTVTGVDDSVADGNQNYNVVTGIAASSDANYNALNPADVAVINVDNDSPGFSVVTTTLVTSEDLGRVSFTVKLNSQPTGSVTIGVSSSNTAEGRLLTPASLVFTTANWNSAQTVTVEGVDDAIADGPQPYFIIFAAAVSTDTGYDGLIAPRVTLANTDNDSPGVTVSKTQITTSESGSTDSFTIKLNSQPTASVFMAVSSTNLNEGTVTTTATVTFTTADWNSLKTITVRGVDDQIADGNQNYLITLAALTSTDSNYNGINPADVSATNTDNDVPGYVVTPVAPATQFPLVTSESGTFADFSVRLLTQPTANVVLPVTSGNLAEGTISTSSLTFTSANWGAQQLVRVTGVNDSIADGTQSYNVVFGLATSADGRYAGTKPSSDVAVQNTDNDSAGVTVGSPSPSFSTEAGAKAQFTIRLNSQPTANVRIDLSSSRPSEGTPDVSSVTFTPVNWSTAQTVFVTGIDDSVRDGDQSYLIITSTPVTTDVNYAALFVDDVSLTNRDNDSAGINVTVASPFRTTEAGGPGQSNTFTVSLNSQPTAPVILSFNSTNANEGIIASPVSRTLTFTSANWSTPTAVVVSGVDDSVSDGDQSYAITFSNSSSTDTNYNNLSVADVNVVNVDNDSAAIVVGPSSISVDENGLQANFTVVLSTQPTANVVVGLTNSNPSEGSLSASSLTFTAANWNGARTVTVTGLDDLVADGNVQFTISAGPGVSADPKYNGLLSSGTVTVTNVDNDSAGVSVLPSSGLTTTENGATAQFAMFLNSQPTANVFVTLSSSDISEGTLNSDPMLINQPITLTFTPANWSGLQFVTVYGLNDNDIDGNVPYSIVTANAVSTDTAYSGVVVADVELTNIDNDTPGISVNPSTGLRTTESGGTASFRVVLNSRPNADVFIHFDTSNAAEGTASKVNLSGDVNTLTFTTLNWNAQQQVVVTGVNDQVQDGDQQYSIIIDPAVSADPGYNGINPFDPSVTNTDNDTAGITVNPAFGSLTLFTSEDEGSANFTVVLNAQPTADVVIGLTSSKPSEGQPNYSSLTFTTANWNSPQPVTVYGQDDRPNNPQDGDQSYRIITAPAVSSDSNYNALNADDVALINTDNDTAGIIVEQPCIFALKAKRGLGGCCLQASKSARPCGGTTSEDGGNFDFVVRLRTQPTDNVYVPVVSGNTAEASVSTSTLTFTTANWDSDQYVNVRGVDDFVADGDQGFTINVGNAISLDQVYNLMPADSVSGINFDDDSAGITVTGGPLTTGEDGAFDSFTVVLQSQPTANVIINVVSSNTAEGQVSPASLTFTAVNWDAPRTVTVTGVNDFVQDGNATYSVQFASVVSADGNYSGISLSSIGATNVDDDSAGITVTPPVAGLSTNEATGPGHTGTFKVRLTSQPVANVVIPLSSSDTGEATVFPTSLTFTAGNWDGDQDVTVTGVDESIQDGNASYVIRTGFAISSDPNYSGRDADDVNGTNIDNDSAGIIVSPTGSPSTRRTVGEGGPASTSFDVSLTSQPVAQVVINLASNDVSEGTISPTSLTFNAGNWDSVQSVTINAVDDAVQDGDQTFEVTSPGAVSADPNYQGKSVATVYVQNLDNDTAGIKVLDATGLSLLGATVLDTFEQDGGVAIFKISLNSEPVADVIIPLSSSDTTEGTVGPSSLTFTSANWNSAQTVFVYGADDFVQDGNIAYTVNTLAAISADPNYGGIDAANASMRNIDNDTAGIFVSSMGPVTTEAGGMSSVAIRLNSQPTADVVIGVSSDDTTEGTLSVSALTFTAANWDQFQSVTITGVDDFVQDGNQSYTFVTGDAVSADPNYSGRASNDVTVLNIDNDTAGFVFGGTPITVQETINNTSFTIFNVKLQSQPTSDVTFSLSSSDPGEGSVCASLTDTSCALNTKTLTFTASNWDTAQGVKVRGIDDALIDGNQNFLIISTIASSLDTNFSVLTPAAVNATCVDND